MTDLAGLLAARRLAVLDQAHRLADTAATEGRTFTEREHGQWETMTAEIEFIDRALAAGRAAA